MNSESSAVSVSVRAMLYQMVAIKHLEKEINIPRIAAAFELA